MFSSLRRATCMIHCCHCCAAQSVALPLSPPQFPNDSLQSDVLLPDGSSDNLIDFLLLHLVKRNCCFSFFESYVLGETSSSQWDFIISYKSAFRDSLLVTDRKGVPLFALHVIVPESQNYNHTGHDEARHGVEC